MLLRDGATWKALRLSSSRSDHGSSTASRLQRGCGRNSTNTDVLKTNMAVSCMTFSVADLRSVQTSPALGVSTVRWCFAK